MKKLLSIILIVCIIMFSTTAAVYATDNTNNPSNEISEQQTVNTLESQKDITMGKKTPEEQAIEKIIAFKKAKGEEIKDDSKAQSEGLIDGGVYYIKNYFSGKYLNVHYGTDANGTNVYQWTKDNSTEQKFKLVYDSANNCYKIYAMCSSNGNNRVIDVVRNNNDLASGQNVDIWTPVDHTAQRLRLTYLIDGLYHIHMLGNNDLYLTTKDSSNGTGSGKSATSAGNVFIQTFNVNDNQQWTFEYLYNSNASSTIVGGIDSANSNRITGWAWESYQPDASVNVNIKVIGNNGTTYLNTIVSANKYHSASYNLGYGNGYHGFSYNFDFSNFPTQTYYIYAYGINSDGTLTQLSNSPCSINYNSCIEVAFTGVVKHQPSWCWAACAEMLGKNALPNNSVTQEYIVEYIKNEYNNSDGGSSEDIKNGAKLASLNNAEFTISPPLQYSEMYQLLRRGYLVNYNVVYEIGGAHAMIIYKCEIVIVNGVAKEKVYIFDPDGGNTYSKYYDELSDNHQTYDDSIHILLG